MIKRLRHLLEYSALCLVFGIFRILPVDSASALGGWLGRHLGPLTGVSRKADRRMEMALPQLGAKQRRRALRDMWDHLGRVFGEYPHLEYIARNRVKIIGEQIVQQALQNGAGGIFCGAHIGNWEVNTILFQTKYSKPIAITYRALNNPYADALLLRARTLNGALPAFRKARESGREMLKILKNKGFLGILIDQKYNEGIAVPFFGMDAMTNPVAVEMAQKLKCPLMLVYNTRLQGAYFEVRVQDPVPLYHPDGTARDARDIMTEIHGALESWIREEPSQWLWVHNRWPETQEGNHG